MRRAVDLRWGWAMIFAFLAQVASLLAIGDPSALVMKKAVLAVTAFLLLLGILCNLRWWAFRVFALGFLLNTLVMSANGGLMPVALEDHERVSQAGGGTLRLGQTPPRSKNVLLAPQDAKLRALSDVIYVPVPRPKVYSVGDLVLMAGLFVFVLEVSVRLGRSRREAGLTPGPLVANEAD